MGESPALVSYVTLKVKTALRLGFKEVQENRPADIPEAELLELIDRYNRDVSMHGILVQLPLLPHISEERVINAIDPEKDVVGFHPVNLGRVVLGGGRGFLPCTPAGIRKMIVRSGTDTRGAEIVVVGRSNIVGKPIALMMGQRGVDGTVTLVHTRTRDLAGHCRRADILIIAAGVPGLVRPEWIKPGATIIDVGVNRIGFNEETGKAVLAGDVDFEEARKVAGKITPVPGGVGPMTIAMLMKNTVESAKRCLTER